MVKPPERNKNQLNSKQTMTTLIISLAFLYAIVSIVSGAIKSSRSA